ncbi:MAG: HupE/UreJ family protein [Betaproteobacteria bacterium]|nr:HupE/UreJ family protein [Betaproteobacteria bacterium]MDH3436579.1 HupE/UreJ family protein [Betaproteobacteria bacterium]
MQHGMIGLLWRAAVVFAASASLAQAHHVMDYAMPATALDGFLSGLGHPVIGLDHLLFIAGAGVFAAQLRRGFLLPLIFVAASILAAAWRAGGASWEMSEVWVAGSLVALGVVMLVARNPGRGLVAALFLVSGTFHGYALAVAIVGAERTPLVAYFAGLTVIQCAIALAAWGAATWLVGNRPRWPLQQLAGAAVGAAGLVFVGLAAL